MSPEKIKKEEKISKKTKKNRQIPTSPLQRKNASQGLINLQKIAGNKAVQRFIQRKDSTSGELDNEMAERINHERSQGHSLDSSIQTQMSQSIGTDFSHVDVHTSEEAHDLNRQLNSKAFTTGKDIFFREGEYQPHTSSGQSLLAHELTHVVQQSSGQVPTSSSMKVNPSDDAFEKQADAIAHNVTSQGNATGIQMQVENEEEEEEEPVQTSRLQRQELTEEEEI